MVERRIELNRRYHRKKKMRQAQSPPGRRQGRRQAQDDPAKDPSAQPVVGRAGTCQEVTVTFVFPGYDGPRGRADFLPVPYGLIVPARTAKGNQLAFAGVWPGQTVALPGSENDRYHRQVTVTFPGMMSVPSANKTKHSFFHPSSFFLRVAFNLVIVPGPD